MDFKLFIDKYKFIKSHIITYIFTIGLFSPYSVPNL